MNQNCFALNGAALFTDCSENFSLSGDSGFVTLHLPQKASYFVASLGKPVGLERFVCSHRLQPFFMDAKSGSSLSELPIETQWLGLLHSDGSYTIILPLALEPFRASLGGNEKGELLVTIETGDDATVGESALALYIAHGDNFYQMMETAGQKMADRLQTCRIRTDKQAPDCMQYFGWCTWNAFYADVSHKKVFEGLESFRAGGIVPKFLLLDDGWQTVNSSEPNRGHHQLSGFEPNEKFNHDLTPTIATAKNEYGVELFYVWHAILGYWGGADPAAMQKYEVRLKCQHHSPAMFTVNEKYATNLRFPYGFIGEDHIFSFYNDYHRALHQQGVDGVKVDVQAALEGAAEGEGGRVRLTNRYREALEASTQLHFKGELINCMSSNNDTVYATRNSNLMRSSDDFFPNKPESHGQHVYKNAINSVWMGLFTWCDWDMFQSAHEYGGFHAAARAISGGPVYVSDAVGEHDFSVIQKLVLSDGTLPLAQTIGRPTMDSLFCDPNQQLFKIFNHNVCSGVVGIFNMQHEGSEPLSCTVDGRDIDGFPQGDYAVYLHNQRQMYQNQAPVSLKPREYEVATIAKIENGIAPIGLAEKFNSGGTVESAGWQGELYSIVPKDDGTLLLYCEKTPKSVLIGETETNGAASNASFEKNGNLLTIQAKKGKPITIS